MHPLRHLLFAVVALLACVVLPVAVVSLWTDSVVTDTDGFVETVGPLADDAVVQDVVQERLVAETLTRLPQAPPRLVDRAATRVVEGPEFRPAWEQANREAHQQIVAVLEADADSRVADDGTVTIQIGPLVVAVVEAVDTTGRSTPRTCPRSRPRCGWSRPTTSRPRGTTTGSWTRAASGSRCCGRCWWRWRCWSPYAGSGRWPGSASAPPWRCPSSCSRSGPAGRRSKNTRRRGSPTWSARCTTCSSRGCGSSRGSSSASPSRRPWSALVVAFLVGRVRTREA